MTTKATPQGTARYQSKFSGKIPPEHFRKTNGLTLSSIGAGTYLGEMDETTDQLYEAALAQALKQGCNVIDTAINYRFQRSERNAGNTLRKLMAESALTREEVVISTKGGFLSFDGEYPPNPALYIQQQYIQKGICTPNDIVANCHCMTPLYLSDQLERSLNNLGVECVDIYFIHNPETQLTEISRQEFLKRMLAAFKLLEKKVADGKIQVYGAATWNGFRESPGSVSYLSLEELVGLARDAGGEDHHFRALQVPFNLGMPEAFLKKNQKLGSASVSLIEAASKQGMIVLCSATILQGRLAANLPDVVLQTFPDLKTDAQRSIQFVRSTPGVTTALVGMSHVEHVNENLQVARVAPISPDKMEEFFTSS
jgi:aryl-alcohol dehydrogenase-like predicted oxidoreductase